MRRAITDGQRYLGALLLGGALILAGCGSSSDDTAASTTTVSTSVANQPPDPAPDPAPQAAVDGVVVPGETGTFPDELLVQCGNPPLFAAGALQNPILLTDTTLSDERAFGPLGEFLASGEGDFWPQGGYWVLANDEQSLLLAHIGTNDEVTLLGSEFDGTSWVPSALQSGGPCPIQLPLPIGVHEVSWRVDPDRPPDATSTSISLLATGQACSGGRPMGDRLQPPQVLLTDTTVYLMLVATELTGAQTCPGNPEEPVTVELGAPLGERPVVDARAAAGVLNDYLPPSPCGQLDPAFIAQAEAQGEPIVQIGPPDRVPC